MWAIIVQCAVVFFDWQSDGATSLFMASENGHVDVVGALVGAGAAVNQADVRDLQLGLHSFLHFYVGSYFAAAACVFRVMHMCVSDGGMCTW